MATLNRQERIFVLIKQIGLSNLQKQNVTMTRYNRKHVCHLNQAQGTDLEAALEAVKEKPTEEALKDLLVPQESLLSETHTFPVPVEYSKV